MDACLSVVMPVYNEAQTVRKMTEMVLQRPCVKELVIVDDGSTDGTRELLTQIAEAERRVHVFFHEKNSGKGSALRTGFAAAQGPYIIVQDADLEYDPAEYPRLLAPVLQDKADVVYGSRFAGSSAHRVVYFWHSAGNRLITLLSNMLSNVNLTDVETCYKLFRKSTLDQITIEEDRFGFEVEITAKVVRIKARMYEVGISYYGRTYDEGKKIGWRDGVHAVWCILKYNLGR
ncbi:MAG: glycosyltransferase family 2 protein [Kiritimatiellales bacterium]